MRIDLERHRKDSRADDKRHRHASTSGTVLLLIGVLGSRNRPDVGGTTVTRGSGGGGRGRGSDDGGTAAAGAAACKVVGVVVGGWDGGAVAVASDDGNLWDGNEVTTRMVRVSRCLDGRRVRRRCQVGEKVGVVARVRHASAVVRACGTEVGARTDTRTDKR